MRKAPKIGHKVLHPGSNKLPLALAVIHDTTIVCFKHYLPERKDAAGFLEVINKWWTKVNCNDRFSPHKLGDAIVEADGKLEFLTDFCKLFRGLVSIEHASCLTPQTSNTLIRTLRGQADLAENFSLEGHEYVVSSIDGTRLLQKLAT